MGVLRTKEKCCPKFAEGFSCSTESGGWQYSNQLRRCLCFVVQCSPDTSKCRRRNNAQGVHNLSHSARGSHWAASAVVAAAQPVTVPRSDRISGVLELSTPSRMKETNLIQSGSGVVYYTLDCHPRKFPCARAAAEDDTIIINNTLNIHYTFGLISTSVVRASAALDQSRPHQRSAIKGAFGYRHWKTR